MGLWDSGILVMGFGFESLSVWLLYFCDISSCSCCSLERQCFSFGFVVMYKKGMEGLPHELLAP